MGYLGVKTIVAHLQGRPVEPRVDTGVWMVTKDNLARTGRRSCSSRRSSAT